MRIVGRIQGAKKIEDRDLDSERAHCLGLGNAAHYFYITEPIKSRNGGLQLTGFKKSNEEDY
jgi:hypothetical protein